VKIKKKVALVLTGGGVLGAYEYGAIKAIYEQGDFIPEVVTGVSAGAINTALLVGGRDEDPLVNLDQYWNSMINLRAPFIPAVARKVLSFMGGYKALNFCSPWFNPLFFLFPLNSTHLFNISPLNRGLNNFLDYEKLNNSPISAVITATNILKGVESEFKNWGGERIDAPQIEASGAVPGLFPHIEIPDTTERNRHFWDGGVVSNTPMRCAINRLEELEPKNKEIERYVISINLFPQETTILPSNMMEVINRTSEIIANRKSKTDHKNSQTFNGVIKLFSDLRSATDELVENANSLITSIQEEQSIEQEGQMSTKKGQKKKPPFSSQIEELVEKIQNREKTLDKLYKHKFLKHQLITPIQITNSQTMPLESSMDFSKSNILDLINCGYLDGKTTLNNILEISKEK